MSFRVLTLLTLLMLPSFSYAFGFSIKIGPIHISHHADRAKVKIDVNKPVENAVRATVSVGKAAAHTVEAAAKVVTGDSKGAKVALKKAENDTKHSVKNIVDTAKGAGDVCYHTAIMLPEAAGEDLVRGSRDLGIELMTGENPKDVQSEISKMFSSCQARNLELRKLNKYLRAQDNFSRNGKYFENVMAVLAALAVESKNGYAIAAVASAEVLYWGMDSRMRGLKKKYEQTVKFCQDIYQKESHAIEDLANARKRKIAVNRNKVLAKINLLQEDIGKETNKLYVKAKSKFEDYLGKSVDDQDMESLLMQYSYLVQDDIDALDLFADKKRKEILNLNKIMASNDELLNYNGN